MNLTGTSGETSLCAAITFVGDCSGTPVNYFDVEPPPGPPKRFATRRVHVPVASARGVAGLSLDREGFILCRDDEGVMPDFYDEATLRNVYHRHVERLVQEHTGARRVIVFDHTHRSSAVTDRLPGGLDAAVDQAHNDYTMRSAPERVREELTRLAPDEDVTRVLAGRFAIVNVWRPINGPVEQSPLALCDQRSIAPDDLVPAELRWAHRTGYVSVLRHHPSQRWMYFPRMTPREALVFTCYDSEGRDGRYFGAHTAFNDPTTPRDARPRESLEVRTAVLF